MCQYIISAEIEPPAESTSTSPRALSFLAAPLQLKSIYDSNSSNINFFGVE